MPQVRAMGSIPKNVKKNISPEFLSPIEMTKGKFFGVYVPVVTTCVSWASGSL